jgi:hypothetical protein
MSCMNERKPEVMLAINGGVKEIDVCKKHLTVIFQSLEWQSERRATAVQVNQTRAIRIN